MVQFLDEDTSNKKKVGAREKKEFLLGKFNNILRSRMKPSHSPSFLPSFFNFTTVGMLAPF